tara:strand:+ start:13082 stop:13204 length:123 start_codon:yes stop_codon:yes gene_type:complete
MMLGKWTWFRHQESKGDPSIAFRFSFNIAKFDHHLKAQRA